MPELSYQANALKSARQRKTWSQSRLASALEQAARNLRCEQDLPPGGRQTLIQYISYFENGRERSLSGLSPFSEKHSNPPTKSLASPVRRTR